MKSKIALFALLTLFTACNSSPKVDLAGELQKEPQIEVSWEGQDDVPGVSTGFCTEVVCIDNGEPDWSAMEFTPFANGTKLNIHVATTLTIEELNVSLKDDEGHTLQNNIDKTDEGNNTYTVTGPFKHTGDLIFSIKVNFVEGGHGQKYFPLAVE